MPNMAVNYAEMMRLQKLAGRSWFNTLKYMPQVKLVGGPVRGINGKWYFVTTFTWEAGDDLPEIDGFALYRFEPQTAAIERVFGVGPFEQVRTAIITRDLMCLPAKDVETLISRGNNG